MFCPMCGANNPDDAAFCSACGASLKQGGSGLQDGNAAGTYETQAAAMDQYPDPAQNAGGAVFELHAQNNYSGQNAYTPDDYGQDPYNRNGYGQYTYNRNGYDQDPYNQNGYGQDPYNRNGYGQDPYNRNGYGQDPYNQNGYGQDPYNQNSYGQDPYNQNGYGQDPYHQGNYYGNYDTYNRRGNGGKQSKTSMILAIAEGALAILALLVIVFGAGRLFTPEKAAERYFVYSVNGEFDKAFRMLDLEESDFVSEDAYEIYWSQYDFQDLDEYEVAEAEVEELEEEENSESESEAESEEEKDSKKKSKKKKEKKKQTATAQADVEITYSFEGMDYDNYFYVGLKKWKSRKYLFFENWIIDPDSLLIHDFKVTAPAASMVKLDDKLLGDEYQSESEDGSCVFLIPELFRGPHTLTVASAGREEQTQKIMLYTDQEEYTVSGMHYNEEVIETLETAAVSNMQLIHATAAKGGSFEEISVLLTRDPDAQEQLRADYARLVDFYQNNDLVEIRFRQIFAYGTTSSTELELNYNYEIDYNAEDRWDGTVSMQTSTQTDSYTVEFTEEDGNWVQKNLGCKPLVF